MKRARDKGTKCFKNGVKGLKVACLFVGEKYESQIREGERRLKCIIYTPVCHENMKLFIYINYIVDVYLSTLVVDCSLTLSMIS